MRLILTFLVFISYNSCKTIADSSESLSKFNSVVNCPDDGKCSLEILEKTDLIVQSDEFGYLYPELITGKFTVLKFEYKRDEIPNTADSGYSEIIYVQLNPESLELELQNKNLANVNMLFGRLCFCRGQTGYYRVRSGNLSIKNLEKDTYQINLEFQIDEVPQIIHQIKETIKL